MYMYDVALTVTKLTCFKICKYRFILYLSTLHLPKCLKEEGNSSPELRNCFIFLINMMDMNKKIVLYDDKRN